MTTIEFSSVDLPARRLFSGVVRTLKLWLAARRAERAQAIALQSLLLAPEHRLRDLGIRREELIQAMEIHRK